MFGSRFPLVNVMYFSFLVFQLLPAGFLVLLLFLTFVHTSRGREGTLLVWVFVCFWLSHEGVYVPDSTFHIQLATIQLTIPIDCINKSFNLAYRRSSSTKRGKDRPSCILEELSMSVVVFDFHLKCSPSFPSITISTSCSTARLSSPSTGIVPISDRTHPNWYCVHSTERQALEVKINSPHYATIARWNARTREDMRWNARIVGGH